MDFKNSKIYKIDKFEEYKRWIDNQDWYQTIQLNRGLITDGKLNTDARIEWFNQFDFVGKSVLDIGCNSGQYSFFAKKKGAKKVVGLDIDNKRIHQAKMLALNEDLDVDFHLCGIEKIPTFGKFDIIICIAVITEIEDLFGALRKIKQAVNEIAILEMDLARPLAYLSSNRNWWKKDSKISRLGKVAEIHRHTHAGWVVHPSFEMVAEFFGDDFEAEFLGRGLRYHKVVLKRK